MIKNTKENRETLALQVVDNMDLKDLISCMVDQISADYEEDEIFQEDIVSYSMTKEDFDNEI